MIFISAYILVTLTLICWQFWPKSSLGSFFGMASLFLLIITGVSALFIEETSISKLAYLSICLLVLALLSFFASKLKNSGFLKLPFLIGSVFISSFIANVLLTKTSTLQTKDFIELDKEGELIVQVKEDQHKTFVAFAQKSSIFDIKRAFDPEKAEITTLDDFYVLDIIDNKIETRIKLIERLKERDEVVYVEENEVVKVPELNESNKRLKADPALLYDDPLNNDQWSLAKTNMNSVYKMTSDLQVQKKARLFILDTGVDGTHEDINEIFISTEKKNDSDKRGHGTHCAGIAGAVTGNNIGISSINSKNTFTISSIKVLADFGGGTQKGIINGMISAIDQGADVISMSLGGRSTDARQRAYNEVVEYANKSNVIIVVAAGNSSAAAVNYSPANTKGVITVGAINDAMELAPFSNTLEGIEMGLSAPGVDILSTFPGNKYEKFSGTSMATPFVAGLVALMKSIKPSITTAEVYDILNNTGINTQDEKSQKIINPSSAIESLLEGL